MGQYINMSRRFYALMAQRKKGVIINILGAAGENPDFDYIAGSSGNASLMAFTRAMGGTAPRDGLRVIGINPRPVRALDRIHEAARLRVGRQARGDRLDGGVSRLGQIDLHHGRDRHYRRRRVKPQIGAVIARQR
jgi:NAD(P)-dependent dehydrogenase (short-subunit alcohol dehydrogenase family)